MFPFIPALTPWNTGGQVRSRSVTAENPTGAQAAGGTAVSPLGPGRKGRPCVPLAPEETLTLADIQGPGVITHIWLTVPDGTEAGPFVLRDLVLRAYWDDNPHPAVEVPLGDFFCNGFATRADIVSLPIAVLPTGGMNSYFPMPFRNRARLTLTSEHPGPIEAVFFQIDYLQYLPADDDHLLTAAPYFHAQWRRTPVTTPGQDHVILDGVRGRGAYVGTHIGVAALERFWWGEGEVKFFLDGDTDNPTICGTGLEDYAGGAWAFQDVLAPGAEHKVAVYNSPYQGHPQYLTADPTGWSPYATPSVPQHGLYRWHVQDPIYFDHEFKVTVQQIGHDGRRLFERSDDVSSVAYWYQDTPQASRNPLPSAAARRPR
ncbi:glycoside hydrolase family 172 protein [Streptomyces shenzhenensis]|uniref:glycoside hydrolase family 172 protein n=1 Tax=Streptomyces shenzhenensis TaxID=943815 RepID=UPI0033EAAD86